jgi:hypothetical protein
MKHQMIILLFGLLSWSGASGQLILTEKENLDWIEIIKNEKDLNRQLEILRERILSDTNIYVLPVRHTVVGKSKGNQNKEIGLCRPILIVDGHLISLSNDTLPIAVEQLTQKLTTKNIKEMGVVDGEKAQSMFGQSGWCGVIMLVPSNKKARKSLLSCEL